jgi:hypothetical protein
MTVVAQFKRLRHLSALDEARAVGTNIVRLGQRLVKVKLYFDR